MLLVIMQRLPETDPDVEQTQAAAKPTKEAAGHDRTKARERQQKVVIGPLRSPGKDDEQHPSHRANQDKQENGNTVLPELEAIGWCRGLFRCVQKSRMRLAFSMS